ncbi:cupin domain-containing protein [Chitinophaga filiformis]|uniref:Cupin domain-containing protein n=1 Tax=Chitinophaga filiformis TaxID=104663 RepID=A0ABY4I4A5_CHIFI|nr:cupin domain-containing protein [Chitinophaga filiformis]UPK69551.1 cupin domain-containing protein [Chitinophaga filiformis]
MDRFIEDKDIQWENPDPGIRRKVMAYNEQLMMVKVAFEQGAVGAIHEHYHSQISHVESGVFEITIDGEKKVLKAGDAYYIPPHVLHGALCLEPGVLIDVFSPHREDFIK